jgi:PhzF family phenazine biosynthesis protein
MKTYFVDSFTDEPFKGNPAGVCFVDENVAAVTMQNIAKEIGFSETAFIQKVDGEHTYSIRYFTPKIEISLCGHATLASAKIIFETTSADQIVFITGENVILPIIKDGEKIVMEFPVYDLTPITVPDSMLAALGIPKAIETSYSIKNRIILIEINDSHALAALMPDFNALVNSYQGINGVLVTAASNTAAYDFQYRYFWPWAGTNEDPVTGGIQTFLTKYWVEKLNKNKLKAFQSSERTGFMTIELKGNKVLIHGEAVIVLEGDFK